MNAYRSILVACVVDASDIIYVSDHASTAKLNPAVRRGIRIGSVKDGVVRVMIPGVGPEPEKENVPEGVAADAKGNIYGAEVAQRSVTKFSRN